MAHPASAKPIRFLLNNRAMSVDDVSPTMSVLEFVRQRTGCMGTKEGCAEGDCGACTVVIGEQRQGRTMLKPVNACIQFMPTLDGKAVFTVEYLRKNDGGLHPVQESLIKNHGAQCGFCTPGFVMSLWGLYLDRTGQQELIPPDEASVRRAITGNLCRCTGYRPIVDAGKQMFDLPVVPFDRAELARSLASLVPPEMPESSDMPGTTPYQFQGGKFFAPRNLAELTALRVAMPTSTLLAGGTDVGLWANKQFRELGEIVYTGEVAELQAISEDPTSLTIGAAVTLTDAYSLLREHYPEMNELWERFASLPIRNVGTLGGNIANGSPIGDSMPALIALGARVTLAKPNRSREMLLEELYIGYQKLAMLPDEVLVSIRIPKPMPRLNFRVYKLSKRFDSDISSVCAAFALNLDGLLIANIRIAFGGMAATPKRASRTEDILVGRRWDESAMQLAIASLPREFSPLSDFRASSQYRMQAACNLMRRFFLETRRENPIEADKLSVFSDAAS